MKNEARPLCDVQGRANESEWESPVQGYLFLIDASRVEHLVVALHHDLGAAL